MLQRVGNCICEEELTKILRVAPCVGEIPTHWCDFWVCTALWGVSLVSTKLTTQKREFDPIGRRMLQKVGNCMCEDEATKILEVATCVGHISTHSCDFWAHTAPCGSSLFHTKVTTREFDRIGRRSSQKVGICISAEEGTKILEMAACVGEIPTHLREFWACTALWGVCSVSTKETTQVWEFDQIGRRLLRKVGNCMCEEEGTKIWELATCDGEITTHSDQIGSRLLQKPCNALCGGEFDVRESHQIFAMLSCGGVVVTSLACRMSCEESMSLAFCVTTSKIQSHPGFSQ